MVSDKAEQFYTQDVDAKYGERYEDVRWHRDAVAESHYKMTLRAINTHFLSKVGYTQCLELGPGGGTWTRELLRTNPDVAYELVDISAKMLEKARAGVGDTQADITYTTADFNAYEPQKTFDCFFSVRALEYVTDKKAAVEKIHTLLASSGSVFIITKTPHYARARISGKTFSALHEGQIASQDLKKLLTHAGFVDIQLFPVTFTFPLLNAAWANNILSALLGWMPLNPVSAFFSESYAVSCTKP